MSNVAKEVAEEEFKRMCDKLDLDLEEMSADDLATLAERKVSIVKAICAGRVTIGEDGMPTVTLVYPVDKITSVTFTRPTGGNIIAVGDTKATNQVTKTHALLSDLTGQPKALFQKMELRPDFRLCDKIAGVFLA
jgi:hypothetical protein